MSHPPLLPINIDDVLHGKTVEWERLEFKRGWNPKDVLHTLCAFANDFHNLGGGYLFVGIVEDQGEPVLPPLGLSTTQLDSIQKEILNWGFKAIQPHYDPVVVPYVIDGKHVLVIWAPAGQNRPYKAAVSLARDNVEWGYFIRKASSTVRARGHVEADLLALTNQIPFDDRINQTASLEDLKRPLIEDFLKEIDCDLYRQSKRLSHGQLCRQMNIASGPNELLRPLNVGLMFFNESPERFFSGYSY